MSVIALIEPQIPQNTGNIARLCSVTGTKLVLLGKLGFELSDKYLKRAGMDYWASIEVEHHRDIEQYIRSIDLDSSFLFSTKSSLLYTEAHYPINSTLLFGNESSGTPEWIMHIFNTRQHMVRIPQVTGSRCLNLAVSAGIAQYELLRQNNFPSLL